MGGYGLADSTNEVLMKPSYYGTRTTPNEKDPGNLRNILTGYVTMTLGDLTKYKHTFFG